MGTRAMMQRKNFIRAATAILLSLGAASALVVERVVPLVFQAVAKAL